MKPGDLVEPIPGRNVLRSGGCAYSCAVVVSVEPFVLVSEEADMRWSATVKRDEFRVIGTAPAATYRRALKRYQRDLHAGGLSLRAVRR